MTPENSTSFLSPNDLIAGLNNAQRNAIPLAVHRELNGLMTEQDKFLFTDPIDRSRLVGTFTIPGYPHAHLDITPYLQQLTPDKVLPAISLFSLTSGHIGSINSYRHELAHYQKAKELGFPDPKIYVYFYYDKHTNTMPQWFINDGPLPKNLTDDGLRFAVYQLCLAPADPGSSDLATAQSIRSYYWKKDRQIYRQLSALNRSLPGSRLLKR